MPSKVPNEILIKIFQQLHPVDQMECTLVCRRWNQIMEDCVLYQTVCILSAVSLKKLLQKIQQRSDIASRIERLALWSEEEEEEKTYSSSKLLSLIPNLKVLYHGMHTVLDNKTKYPWCNQIEYISEVSRDDMCDQVLSCEGFPNLKTFIYSYYYYGYYPPLIKTAFGLTNLVIEEGEMGFDDLECIHENSPHLKSLKFGLLYYKGGAIFSEREITPATSVTEFLAHVDCKDVDPIHPELHVELLVHISKKYPNLSTLEYKYCGNDCLKSSEADEIIKMGWNPLLQRLGPQLKKVSIYLLSEEEQIIEAFDRFDCQIDYLDLNCKYQPGIAKMPQSKQAFYIQTLVLCIESPSLDWLKSLRVLKNLELTYKNDYCSPNLQLSDILDNSSPTLESLFLCADRFDINPSYTGTCNIKTLTFQSMKFDDKIDGFISRCFPQLSVLELRKCELQNNTLNLEKTDLANFYYYIYKGTPAYPYHCDDDVILVTALKDNKSRFYVLHDKQYGLDEVFYPQNYIPFKSYPASDVNDPKPALNFICNSVTNVAFTTSSYPSFITYE